MDKHILDQYQDMKKEERDLISRIQSLDARILNLEVNTIVSDTVTRGKHGKKSLGTVRIEGFPSMDYQRKKGQLKKLKALLVVKDAELLSKLTEVEQYIEDVADSRIRQIMRYRYIDDLTWTQISHKLKETESSPRMALERYLSEENEQK